MKSVDIIIPAYNESSFLEENVMQLYNFLKNEKLNFNWTIIIGENGSKDNTLDIAKKLSKKYKKIKWAHNDIGSRDRILKRLWGESKVDIVMYTDADMSVHPKYIPPLVNKILDGYDLAIGSRMLKDSIVKREKKRVFMSRIYNNFLVPFILPTGVKDAQCGFKAARTELIKSLIPKLCDENGFMDTEMLAVSNSKGLKIAEIPVEWSEGRESTMSVWKNVPNFLKNLVKTRWKIITGFYNK
ncbi:MAG: glycosyltransferase [Candidatus Nanoarchaeia archaeon]|nr:glycosyltransferase [Candidatus Nanoarchaeia archaeon]